MPLRLQQCIILKPKRGSDLEPSFRSIPDQASGIKTIVRIRDIDVPEAVLKKAKYAEVVGPNVDLRVLADISGCYEIMVALGRENKKISDYTLQEFNQRFSHL